MPNEKSQAEAEESLRRWFPDAFKEQDEHRAKLKELFDFPIRRLPYGTKLHDEYIEKKPDNTEE